ncbi:hypothetical protein MTO96_043769 [Rhipicephalus appendiculatus]
MRISRTLLEPNSPTKTTKNVARAARCTRRTLRELDSLGTAMEHFTDADFLDMDLLDESIAALEEDMRELQERLARAFQELRGGHRGTGDDTVLRPSEGAPTAPGHRSGSMGDGPLQSGDAKRESVEGHDCPADSEDVSRDGLERASVGDSEGPAVSEDTARNVLHHANVEARDLEGEPSPSTAYEASSRGTRSRGCGDSARCASSDATSNSSCRGPAMNAAASVSETPVAPITEATPQLGPPRRRMLPPTEHSSQML